jgi:hypothetical protein
MVMQQCPGIRSRLKQTGVSNHQIGLQLSMQFQELGTSARGEGLVAQAVQ